MKEETRIMKHSKNFLFGILSLLSISSLVACSGGNNQEEPFEEPIYEIGDTVIAWTQESDYGRAPLGVIDEKNDSAKIVKDFGHEDKQSIYYEVEPDLNGGGMVASEELEDMFFTDDHVKNGDIVSAYIYLPQDSNVDTIQLNLQSSSRTYEGNVITAGDNTTEKWIRTAAVFDALDLLTSIRLVFTIKESGPAKFYADDINIVYGEETVANNYERNNESLRDAFDGYLTVGNIMSTNMYNNTKMRQILKENFNSITAENEGKPDAVLDQTECQKLAKNDETAVAISTSRFEKIYDWCEAHHIPVRHHTFVWHQQTPDWFFKKGYQSNGEKVSRQAMLARLSNYYKVMIETLDARWPGLVYALDVVNEAVEEVGQIRRGNWYDTVGEDYIYQAFKAASEHKKDYMDLYYNDYAFEQTQWGGVDRCQWAVDSMLRQAIDEDLIDGIGIQSHIEFSDVDTVLEDARIIHTAGLKCQITELDINCNGEQEFGEQKNAYYKVVKGVLDGNKNGTMDVNAIIVWGITDNTSWHSNRSPLMFDSNYGKKPAYFGFLEAMQDFLQGK